MKKAGIRFGKVGTNAESPRRETPLGRRVVFLVVFLGLQRGCLRECD